MPTEERRTTLKLSAAAREVWALIQDAYSSPAKSADRRRFEEIKRKR